MINVYDILVNFQDSVRVYEFFEWNNKDDIEHIKKMPMIKVNSNILGDMIKYTISIEKDLLTDIYTKTEIYNNDKVNVIDYACLFTDGCKVLAIEFNDQGKSLYKSFLLLDEEEELLEICEGIKTKTIKYKKTSKKNNTEYLTREEEYRKNYLLKELRSAKKYNKYEKINYLYEEIYPASSKNITQKYEQLVNDITNNYRDCYNKLFNILNLTHSKKKTINF